MLCFIIKVIPINSIKGKCPTVQKIAIAYKYECNHLQVYSMSEITHEHSAQESIYKWSNSKAQHFSIKKCLSLKPRFFLINSTELIGLVFF